MSAGPALGTGTDVAIVTVTVDGRETALEMAEALVARRLAACVQILPITSIYRWEGKVETAAEHLLVCKVVAADFAAIEAAIRAKHTYDVPEIVMTPVTAGHAAYVDWIKTSCAGDI